MKKVSKNYAKIFLPIMALLTLLPFVDPALALALGVGFAFWAENPYGSMSEKLPKTLLAYCVIGLGAGMNLLDVLQVGQSGFIYTAISILCVGVLGWSLSRFLKIDTQNGILITVGTAICGGSAIAAIAPVIQARSSAIAISLGVVFVLNALALIVFPYIGHLFDMSQYAFGLWSALAIHDTSSVVGAGLKYGEEALQTGTSVKLARALWIVPLVFAFQYAQHRSTMKAGMEERRTFQKVQAKYPWFILGFLAMAALFTFMPFLSSIGAWIEFCARRGLVLTLFLIGVNINLETLKQTGAKPLVFGAALWAVVSIVSLLVVENGVLQ